MIDFLQEWIKFANFPMLLKGFWLTLELSIINLSFGFFLAVLLAIGTRSKYKILSLPSKSIILYFRGTPLLVQLFLIYFGGGQFSSELEAMGLWQYFREAYFCALLALTLNTGAYTAEILRKAMENVDSKQIEAAKAIGMNKFNIWRRVIWPRAFRFALPSYGNEAVFLMQATSLVSLITLVDLTQSARNIIKTNFAYFEVFITAALMYLILSYLIVFIFKRLEKLLPSR